MDEDEHLLKLLRRAEDALARFYVAHLQAGCTGCELCRSEFWEGMKGGMNIFRLGEKLSDPVTPMKPNWQNILEEAGYWHTAQVK
jgi:hypothetical protein